jgi:prolyl 4-hydroxylase
MFPYSKVYGNAIPENMCKNIIYMFEMHPEEQEQRDIGGIVRFTEVNINKSNIWEPLAKNMLEICADYLTTYRKEFKIVDEQFPKKYGLEQIRIKKYLPNDFDEFKMHVDADDVDSSKRMVSYLFYLNDVEEGGETTFGVNEDWRIKPKQGNLLMFPPLWTHPHRGRKPISGPKYILTTYINYV